LTRLVFVPAVMIPIFVALGFRGAELGALFVLFASPCANSCGIMAQQYNIKPLFTAQVVGATTLFSGLTTFIGIFLLKALGLF
jgi:predicted permease